MLDFAHVLPHVRERIAADLSAPEEVTRERVLACALRLLDRHSFRVGGEEYAADNESFGLATLRKDHVTVTDRGISVDYPAKSGRRLTRFFSDPDLHDVMRKLRRRRGGGDELLAYRRRRRWLDLRSEDINAHVKEVAGERFSAKDFRTWHATVLAALALAVSGEVARGSQHARKRAKTRAVEEVARYSATRRPSPAPRTSTRASSIATTRGSRSSRRSRGSCQATRRGSRASSRRSRRPSSS
jgi:DNA topoisomerase IB